MMRQTFLRSCPGLCPHMPEFGRSKIRRQYAEYNSNLIRVMLVITSFFLSAVAMAQKPMPATEKTDRSRIAAEMATSVTTELLDKYYPQNIDSLYGGFTTTSRAMLANPHQSYCLKCAANGFHFLQDVMWDKQNGGFYNLVDRQGQPKINPKAPKEAYGNAFAIYALSAYYKASKDTGALGLAKRTFAWLEKHSHDPVNRGYHQNLEVDGTPLTSTIANPEGGYKDQNSSIHLLEAFTELYSVWPDPLLRKRLEEMLRLIQQKMITPKGYLTLFFKANWKPVSFRDSSDAYIRQHKFFDHVSFGHDVETAYLMLEASHALGLKNDKATIDLGKRMVDHSLQNGWDGTLGGFYDEGYYYKNKPGISILLDSKNWWAQAEGLNTLLLMADRYPNDKMQYFQKFKQLWNYVQTYLIDHENGDWYEEGLDKEPQRKIGLKAHIWKATYHNYRALANCIQRLQHPSDE